MTGRYKKLIVIPIVVIIISLYLIGVNLINRIDRVDDLQDALPTGAEALTEADTKTAEQEEEELSKIKDKININTATKSELMLLDGIGETLAQRIIERRETVGEFTSIDQLFEIEGMGEKKYNGIKDYITVENQQSE
ncbi:MAG: helix-hairpin-helix domain-containing protein [Clostridia bacterium]|nr:helix-hairpin-helix domain-containing protein [Clostridia bacterium]